MRNGHRMTIWGSIAGEPRAVPLADGRLLFKFSLRCSPTAAKRDETSGEWLADDGFWVNVIVFDSERSRLATVSSQILRRGSNVLVFGRLKEERYFSPKHQKEMTQIALLADAIEFFDPRQHGDEPPAEWSQPEARPQSKPTFVPRPQPQPTPVAALPEPPEPEPEPTSTPAKRTRVRKKPESAVAASTNGTDDEIPY